LAGTTFWTLCQAEDAGESPFAEKYMPTDELSSLPAIVIWDEERSVGRLSTIRCRWSIGLHSHTAFSENDRWMGHLMYKHLDHHLRQLEP